ncbi:MAG: hypothetical protein AAB539_04745 [Patescibacteria group bacterium]
MTSFHISLYRQTIRRLFVTLLISSAFAGGVLLFFAVRQFGHRAAPHSVVVLETGFYPAVLVIRPGDIVHFTTETGNSFWPASDMHPTHAVYPEFDPKKPIAPDAEWSFRFDRIGRWEYHDHLHSLRHGIIEVRPSNASARAEASISLAQLVDKELRERGIASAFNLVAARYADGEVGGDCHGYAHRIGQEAYRLFRQGGKIALTPQTSYCGYGFYHGFMETLLETTGDMQEARKFCLSVGKQLSGMTADASGACFHGIGHGAVDGGDPGTWGDAEAMMRPGMEFCERVSQDPSERYRCVTGVFNAIEILAADPKYRLENLRRDPFSLCKNPPAFDREPCYTNMLPALLGVKGGDYQAAFTAIAAIQENSADYSAMFRILDDDRAEKAGYLVRATVVLGLAHELIRSYGQKQDYAATVVGYCRALSPPLVLPCIQGLAGGHMKYGEPTREYIKGLAFCEDGILRDDEAHDCNRHILRRLRLWYDARQAAAICASVPVRLQSFCR